MYCGSIRQYYCFHQSLQYDIRTREKYPKNNIFGTGPKVLGEQTCYFVCRMRTKLSASSAGQSLEGSPYPRTVANLNYASSALRRTHYSC